MARPTIINDDIIDRVVGALRAGNYITTACEWAGISHDAYYDWLAKGDEPDADPLFKRFSDEVKKARAEAEVANVQIIRRAGEAGTWQASAWWLERSFPARWGRKTEITGPNQGPIQVEVTRDELKERILTLLESDGSEDSA
jgi:transposase